MTLCIDRYVVTGMLGHGATGKVYLANDPKLDRRVAIKLLNATTDDGGLRRRFQLEARAIAALNHPNIVELYDYSGPQARYLYLVMEYVPGPSLYELLDERGPMSEPTALCVAHELCLALAHAHAHDIVHRDLKPENVLLAQGRVVLTDFGGVKAIRAGNALGVSVSRHTQVLGTPGFMALEQFAGKGIDSRTDIFALGAVLYNLVTARLPFEGECIDDVLARTKSGRMVDPRRHDPRLSEGLCELIGACLAGRPRQRPTAADVRARIIELLRSHGVTEVRQELSSYQHDPASHEQQQRQRNLDALVRDLKVALKDHDARRARAILRRLQLLAPLGEHIGDISGVMFSGDQRPVLVAPRRPRRAAWLMVGLLTGLLLGTGITGLLAAKGAIPPSWLEVVSRLQP